jgi:hypothetical protein
MVQPLLHTSTRTRTLAKEFPDNLLAFLTMVLGAILIWRGPSISGFDALHGAWCRQAGQVGFSLGDVMNFLSAHHCPVCYVGAAMILYGLFMLVGQRAASRCQAAA